jgi:thymidylate synthase
MIPGKLIGFLADVHIYVNQMEGVEEQLSRTPKALPLCTTSCTDVLDWNWDDFSLIGYDPCDPIHFEIAV